MINYSYLPKERICSFYQIKIIEKLYDEILENIVEDKSRKLSSDELLKVSSLNPILLKFRLLQELTNNEKPIFVFNMNSLLYMNKLNSLTLKLNSLLENKSKKSFKKFFSFCLENHQFLNIVENIFPYNKFNKDCNEENFDISFYYIKMMIEFYKNQTNFIFIFDDDEFPFIFEDEQYDRLFPILKLNEKKNIFLSNGTMIKIYLSQYLDKEVLDIKLIDNDDDSKKNTIHFLKFLTEFSGKIDLDNI